jgi:hypothetical protein
MTDRKYAAWLIFPELPFERWRFKNAVIDLYRDDIKFEEEEKSYNWQELIEGYDKNQDDHARYCFETKMAILENFTLDEIEAIKKHLNYFEWLFNQKMSFHFSENEYPWASDTVGCGWIGAGGDHDDYLFYKNKNYPLGFDISGHFHAVNIYPSYNIRINDENSH